MHAVESRRQCSSRYDGHYSRSRSEHHDRRRCSRSNDRASPARHRHTSRDLKSKDLSTTKRASDGVPVAARDSKKARSDRETETAVLVPPNIPSLEEVEQNEERMIEERRARRKALFAASAQPVMVAPAPVSGTVDAETQAEAPLIAKLALSDTPLTVDANPVVPPARTDSEVVPVPFAIAAQPELDMFSDDLSAAGSVDAPLAAGGVLALGTQQLDMFQDADGYMQVPAGIRIGPNRCYAVKTSLGKGMFAVVVAANKIVNDSVTNEEVALKIFRANDLIRRQGLREIRFLEQIIEADPLDRCHLLRLQGHFEEGTQKHLCMVFERMEMNARELMLKHGRQVGLGAPLVSAVSHQLLLSLLCLRTMRVLHADLKPDNVLVDTRNDFFVRLGDFNSALAVSEVSLTSELQSRFYRAPEVMLGAHSQIDYAIDMWSLGCTLFELYTGRVLFPGRDNNNNHMLYLIQQLRGALPKRLVKAGSFSSYHYDADGNFLLIVDEPSRKASHARPIHFSAATPLSGITSMLSHICSGSATTASVSNRLLADFLDRCLHLDPKMRLTPEEALTHPFVLLWKQTSQQQNSSN